MKYFLAIVGGLILLVNMGPGTYLQLSVWQVSNPFTGGLSVDEKKKTY